MYIVIASLTQKAETTESGCNITAYKYNSSHHSWNCSHMNYGHKHDFYQHKIQNYIEAENNSMGLDTIQGKNIESFKNCYSTG